MASTAPAAGPAIHGEGNSLRDVFSVLFRHKWKAVLFFLVVVSAVALGTFSAREIYESEAKILLKPGRESIVLDTVLPQEQVISVRRTAEEQLRSELAIIQSRLLAEKVVDSIGAEQFLRLSGVKVPSRKGWFVRLRLATAETPRQLAVRTLMKHLKADAVRATNVLHLTYQSPNPELAQRVLQSVVDGYMERHLEVYRTGAALTFFQKQTERLRKELEQAEAELTRFKNEANIADLKEQRTRAIARLSDLQIRANKAAAALAASEARVAQLKKAVDELPMTLELERRTGADYRYMDEARLELLRLRLQEKELLSQYPEDNRLVRAVRERIQEAEKALAGEQKTRTEVTTGVNLAHQQLYVRLVEEQAALAAAREQKNTLEAQLAAARATLTALNDRELKLNRLLRRRDIAERNYRAYADRLEDARSAQALETEKVSNVALVQPATMPIRPVKPRKGVNLLLALVLGALGGIGLAFLGEHLDHSFHRPEQVEKRLGVPVLAVFPRTGKAKTLTLRG